MRAERVLLLAWKGIWLHRLRSLLTTLGIVLGVSSVVAMLAIGEGASVEAQNRIRRLGSRNIILTSAQPPQSESASVASEVMSGPCASRLGLKTASTRERMPASRPNRRLDQAYTRRAMPAPMAAARARPRRSMDAKSLPSPKKKARASDHWAELRQSSESVDGKW